MSRLFAGLFPERQIFYRSRGRVRYISLTWGRQMPIVLAFLGLLFGAGWTGYFIASLRHDLATSRVQISSLNLQHQTAEFERQSAHQILAALTEEIGAVAAEAGQRTTVPADEFDPFDLAKFEEFGQQYVAQIADRVAALQADRDQSKSLAEKKDKELEAGVARLEQAEEAAVQAHRRVTDLLQGVGDLEGRVREMQSAQRRFADWIHEVARIDIERAERALAHTKLDVDEVLRQVMQVPVGQGGPAAPPIWPDRPVTENAAGFFGQTPNMDSLQAELARWTALRTLTMHMPLARPVDRGWISSVFGRRKDPFTKKKSFHSGIDIAAPKKTSIYATAPGTVVFAGDKGSYGRFVEIDHGLGFRTRYGHLHRILVDRGQQVDFRTKIGLMGSSGRSTSSHVHYEVLLGEKTFNPVDFFKAGYFIDQDQPD